MFASAEGISQPLIVSTDGSQADADNKLVSELLNQSGKKGSILVRSPGKYNINGTADNRFSEELSEVPGIEFEGPESLEIEVLNE